MHNDRCPSETVRFLIYGDSYAHSQELKSGLQDVFETLETSVRIYVESRPGFTTSKLLKELTALKMTKMLCPSNEKSFHFALVISGINDIIARRGARRFARSLTQLLDGIKEVAEEATWLQIIAFNEKRDPARLRGKLKHTVLGLLRDREGHRIQRYREAARVAIGDRIISTGEFMPVHDPVRFGDGVHLHPDEFRGLGRFVGKQIVKRYLPTQVWRTE